MGEPPASAAVVREATPDDAAALVVLRDVMFDAMGVPPERLTDDAWRRAAREWFVQRIGTAGVRVVVAEVDGDVVAAAVGEVTALIPGPGSPNGSVGLVSNVATLPGHRGRGLAAAVTDDLMSWFVGHTDVTRVDLFATPGGARIYEPRGFVQRSFPAMSFSVPRDGPGTTARRPAGAGRRDRAARGGEVSRPRPRA
jgi:GNAT superfamily N-acetyltransferase